MEKIVKKFFVKLLKILTKSLDDEQEVSVSTLEQTVLLKEQLPSNEQEIIPIDIKKTDKKLNNYSKKKHKNNLMVISVDPRDITEIMGAPFLALSKNRKAPIIYESHDGKIKVKISRHTKHYLASIYDWDIVIFAASRLQEILNSGSDIPPRTLIVPRHEILKAIRKQDGKKEEKDLIASLSRLQTTAVETTIRNEDGRYDAGFGFIDSWGYTNRKDVKEFSITLSQWLYEGICGKGALLKIPSEYFGITSGLKKFLYRTARKHVGKNEQSWKFSIEKLYEKSGSEQELKQFKYNLRKAVLDDDIPEYSLKWVETEAKTYVIFLNRRNQYTRMFTE